MTWTCLTQCCPASQEESGESNHLSFGLTIAEKLDRRFNKPKKAIYRHPYAVGVMVMQQAQEGHLYTPLCSRGCGYATSPRRPSIDTPNTAMPATAPIPGIAPIPAIASVAPNAAIPYSPYTLLPIYCCPYNQGLDPSYTYFQWYIYG